MRTRLLASWVFVAMLLGVIVISYGLDSDAALYGDYRGPQFEHSTSDSSHHMERLP